MGAESAVFPVSIGTSAGEIGFQFSDSGHLDYIAGLVRTGGLASYEAPLPLLIARLIARLSGFVIDIGANTGLFSLLAAASNSQVRVCAFEPLKSVHQLLCNNVALNPDLAPRIQTYQVGISNKAGNIEFFETINDHGLVTTSSSLEISHVQATGNESRKQVIVTERLDDWVAVLGDQPVGFIKVDVEGHEYAVIEGARRSIDRHRPLLTIEVLGNARLDPIQRMIFETGYLDFAIRPDALVNCNSVRHFPDAWNHLLCPPEKLPVLLQLCRELRLTIDFA